MLCRLGDVIAIESCGMQALEIPTHPRDGISLDALQLAIDQWPIKACLLVANFNNPRGSCMLDDRKQSLITLLDQHGIPLIEDDVYGDLAFGQARSSILMSHNKWDTWFGS